MTGGGTPSTKEEKYWLGTMPWISSSDLIEFNINKISETRFISNEAIENSATKIVPAFSILVVTRVGLGKVAVNEHPICTSQDFTNLYSNNVNPYYFAYLIQKHLSKKVPQGSTIKGISSKELAKMDLTFPTKNEQDKIYSFLHVLDKKIDVINSKIAILKKYKEGIEKYAYKFVENQGVSIKFSDLFDNLIEKNNHKFQQYTLGKNGIKKIDEINYDISNHKIFKKFNIIVGIGIDEIGINKDLECGSVSPVYDVYNIRNLKYFDSIYVTLKEQLWKKRNFITRKSTRREFEVDKYELKKTILRVVDNKDFTNVYQSITNIKKAIEILNFSFNNLKIIKSYILRHMFI